MITQPKDDDDVDERYFRHLYLSMGKITNPSMSMSSLKELYLEDGSRDNRKKQLLKWITDEREFTLYRQGELVETLRIAPEAAVPLDVEVMLKAWAYLGLIVFYDDDATLRKLWHIFTYFDVTDDQHDPFSWHLAVIIYQWIHAGIEKNRLSQESNALICQQLKAIQCYLNLTPVEGGNAIRAHWLKQNTPLPVYLLRLSVTHLGVVSMQLGIPGRLRLDGKDFIRSERLESDVSFHASKYEYSVKCAAITQKYIQINDDPLPRIIKLDPTPREMLGFTKAYNVYFGIKSSERPYIPLADREGHIGSTIACKCCFNDSLYTTGIETDDKYCSYACYEMDTGSLINQ